MKRQIRFTQDGYNQMEAEYKELQEKRKEAVELLATARAMGDLSENAAYTAAKRKLGSVDSRLRYLNNTLKNAVIVQPTSTDKVEIGSKVTVNDGKNTREFTIVGGHESDIMNGKLSCYSPIGKALMYRKVGDKVLVHIPAGEVVYTVISISL